MFLDEIEILRFNPGSSREIYYRRQEDYLYFLCPAFSAHAGEVIV